MRCSQCSSTVCSHRLTDGDCYYSPAYEKPNTTSTIIIDRKSLTWQDIQLIIHITGLVFEKAKRLPLKELVNLEESDLFQQVLDQFNSIKNARE